MDPISAFSHFRLCLAKAGRKARILSGLRILLLHRINRRAEDSVHLFPCPLECVLGPRLGAARSTSRSLLKVEFQTQQGLVPLC